MMKDKRRSSIRLFFIMVILISLTNLVFADLDTPISMDFKNVDLRDVFRILAQLADVNLISHQTVGGEVTLTLNELTFIEAINLITIVNDLSYYWIDNTIVIASPEKIRDKFNNPKLEIFKVQYASLDRLKEILDILLVDTNVVVDSRTRNLLVTSGSAQLAHAREVITRLDFPVPQIFLDVRVEEISTVGLKKIGVPQGSPVRLQFSSNDESLFPEIGLEFPSIIEALNKEGLSKTLANPGLITLDGETAKLLIGDKIPVEAEDEVDGKIKTSIKYMEAGIKLEFTPRISDDEYITLNVKPQINSIGEHLTKGYPIIKSREVETIVRIRNGETFVLGGLIREEDRKNIEKVPFLGDIPILGGLFKHNEKTEQGTEVVIFITPYIIYPEVDPKQVVEVSYICERDNDTDVN